MQSHWKRGLTRIYLVLWVIWLSLISIPIFTMHHILGVETALEITTLLGVVIPGMLFLALRWILAGFSDDKSA
jgi:hypothetical protein